MTLEEREKAFLEAPDNHCPGHCTRRNDNLMPELSQCRTRFRCGKSLKGLTRLEQVYPSPLLPHHSLRGRIRGGKNVTVVALLAVKIEGLYGPVAIRT